MMIRMTSRIIITSKIMIMVLIMIIIRRTEGTEEQGVSDPQHPSLLAS